MFIFLIPQKDYVIFLKTLQWLPTAYKNQYPQPQAMNGSSRLSLQGCLPNSSEVCYCPALSFFYAIPPFISMCQNPIHQRLNSQCGLHRPILSHLISSLSSLLSTFRLAIITIIFETCYLCLSVLPPPIVWIPKKQKSCLVPVNSRVTMRCN